MLRCKWLLCALLFHEQAWAATLPFKQHVLSSAGLLRLPCVVAFLLHMH